MPRPGLRSLRLMGMCEALLVSDYRWQVLEDARPTIKEAFLREGVIRVEVVAAFPDQAQFAVWLGTTTDAETRRLRSSRTARARVHELLMDGGLGEQDLDGLAVVVQSQETVDMEYDGSWFNALR